MNLLPTTYRPDNVGGWHILNLDGSRSLEPVHDEVSVADWALGVLAGYDGPDTAGRLGTAGVRERTAAGHHVLRNMTEKEAHRQARTLGPRGYSIGRAS